MRAADSPSDNPTLPISSLTATDAATLDRPTTLLWLAGLSFLCVPLMTLVDVPISRWFVRDPFPRELTEALELTRIFSHGSGVFVILLGILLLAPRRRWHVPRLASLALGGGAVATIAKMFVLRPRPYALNLDIATYESAWLWVFDWSLSRVAAFDAGTRAFPSGNMATATALTIGLWVVFPRGRWLFATVCLGTLVHRLLGGAHFLSDTIGGAAIGFLWSYVCYHPKLLGNVFDKMATEPLADRRRRFREQSETRPPQSNVAA